MINIINPNKYIKSPTDLESLQTFMKIFDKNIKSDGVRKRAYLKLIWNRKSNSYSVAHNQNYFQSSASNSMDGGKVRQFSIMDKKILDLSIIKNIFKKNLQVVNSFNALKNHKELVIGLHFIRYQVAQYSASYSSPDGLHIDDEPLVFIHLLHLSSNAWGGDNLIADIRTKEITNVARLENPLETMVLTKDYYHAVTPLGVREGVARRDILLFTVEPVETQIETAA